MKYLLVLLSITCLLAAIAAPSFAADKYDRGPQRIDSDPSSTFDVGSAINVFPLDTVQVPVYLSTTNTVTYVENSIDWDADDLTLLDVVEGGGIDDSVSVDLISQSAGNVRFKFEVGGDPVSVGSDPLVYLVFEVQCFGYNASTSITLTDDNNYNFYVSGGVPAAPLRDNGSVTTRQETLLYLWANATSAYVGQADIPVRVTFYQTVPGRIESVTLDYDDTQFSVDSVTALSGLDVSVASNSGGTLEVDITSDMLAAGQWDLFKIHLRSLSDSDGIISTIDLTDATRVNACGITTPMTLWDGNLTIPLHTASADMDEISRYTSATYYDVPVIMDSNHPINAYELHINFPADQIYFDEVVASGGFTPALGGVDPGDTTMVSISNGSGTDYDPSALPATVFYLRFRPWNTPSAGTVFDLTYDDPNPENVIQYWTDLNSWHDADITALDPGSITITSPPGGGGGTLCCPALYVWDGGSYVLDNNILPQCDGRRVDAHVIDHYRVTQPVADGGGVLRFQIRENANARSEFSDFELVAFDHPAGEDVHVTREGDFVVNDQPFAIAWARDHTGRDIKSLIEAPDNVLYQSSEDGWLEVSLGTLSESQIGKFASETHDALAKNKTCPPEEQMMAQGIDIKKSRKLRVSIRAADGGWVDISESDARHNPVRQTTIITPELIGDQELVLRYSWESYYRIDVLEFSGARPFDGALLNVPMIDASRVDDDVVAARLTPGAGDMLTLAPGQVIDVAFDSGDLPAVRDGYTREYVFVSTGKYTEPGVGTVTEAGRGFALDANVPNPFNPRTTIRYSLASATRVDLAIYDVRGALVRRLVSEFQPAGEKSIEWNGVSESGSPMASGVYFYRLRTPEYTQTRKMILLK